MLFHTLRGSCDEPQMPFLERKASSFHRRSLLQSSQPDSLIPLEHRKSIVEAQSDHAPSHGALLTGALLESHPKELEQATQAPFLRQAGSGKLPKSTLSRWLSQDRLYAETYICFISSLLARVHLPYNCVSDKSQSLRWRIINLLTGALQNIHREIEFFHTTADDYDLRLDQPSGQGDSPQVFLPEEATQQYMDLFRSFQTDATLPLIEGMVILWATEYCYLHAWMYASQFGKEASSDNAGDDADGGACRDRFIPNWTSGEFKEFVDEIAELTNLLAERENANRKLEVHKAVWLHVLDIERRFWPDVDTSLH